MGKIALLLISFNLATYSFCLGITWKNQLDSHLKHLEGTQPYKVFVRRSYCATNESVSLGDFLRNPKKKGFSPCVDISGYIDRWFSELILSNEKRYEYMLQIPEAEQCVSNKYGPSGTVEKQEAFCLKDVKKTGTTEERNFKRICNIGDMEVLCYEASDMLKLSELAKLFLRNARNLSEVYDVVSPCRMVRHGPSGTPEDHVVTCLSSLNNAPTIAENLLLVLIGGLAVLWKNTY